MNTVFSVILEDFEEELLSLEELTALGQTQKNSARVRVASVNGMTLLLAATFEEFIRQMAQAHAMQTVSRASEVSELPDVLLETAWRRTLEDIGRSRVNRSTRRDALAAIVASARPKFDAVVRFLQGDIEEDIFGPLIHNENNMRAKEINGLFKVSGTSNVCQLLCDGNANLGNYFGESDPKKVNGQLLQKLDDFFDRRNGIAHALNVSRSAGANLVTQDIMFFRALAQDLSGWLDSTLQ